MTKETTLNEEKKYTQGEGDYFATPAERLIGDMDMLKNVGNSADLLPEQAEQIVEKINGLVQSVLDGMSTLTPDKLKENTDILKGLAEKGYTQAGDALSKLNEKTNGGVEALLGADPKDVMNVMEGTAKVIDGLDKNNNSQVLEGMTQAGMGGMKIALEQTPEGRAAAMTGNMANMTGELKKDLAAAANFGQGDKEVVSAPSVPLTKEAPQTELQSFMDQKYAAQNGPSLLIKGRGGRND